MAYKIYSQNGKLSYGIKEYFVDTLDDIKNLPVSVNDMGSSAITATGDVAFLTSNGYWVTLDGTIITKNNGTNKGDENMSIKTYICDLALSMEEPKNNDYDIEDVLSIKGWSKGSVEELLTSVKNKETFQLFFAYDMNQDESVYHLIFPATLISGTFGSESGDGDSKYEFVDALFSFKFRMMEGNGIEILCEFYNFLNSATGELEESEQSFKLADKDIADKVNIFLHFQDCEDEDENSFFSFSNFNQTTVLKKEENNMFEDGWGAKKIIDNLVLSISDLKNGSDTDGQLKIKLMTTNGEYDLMTLNVANQNSLNLISQKVIVDKFDDVVRVNVFDKTTGKILDTFIITLVGNWSHFNGIKLIYDTENPENNPMSGTIECRVR